MIPDDFQKQVDSVQESDQAESGLDSSLDKNQQVISPNGEEVSGEVDHPLEANDVPNPDTDLNNDVETKMMNSENDQTSVPIELIQTGPEGEARDSDIPVDMETVWRENTLLRQQLQSSENTIRLLRNQIESTEQLLCQPEDQDDLSSKKQLEQEIVALQSERDSLASQLASLHHDLLLSSSSSSALHQNNVLLTAIVEDEANNTGSLNLLLNEKAAEVYRLKNDLATAQAEREASQRQAEESERLLEEEADALECLRKENCDLMNDLTLLREQTNRSDETHEETPVAMVAEITQESSKEATMTSTAEMERMQRELELAREEIEKQKSMIETLQQQILEGEKGTSTGIDLGELGSRPGYGTTTPEETEEKDEEESVARFMASVNGRVSVESSLPATEDIMKDPLEQSFTDASDVAGLSLLQVHRETLQELDAMRSRAEEAESALLRSQTTVEELQQQLLTSQQETAEWRSQAEKRSLELATMAQEAQSQRLRADDLEDVRQGLLQAMKEWEETPSKTAEWQSRAEEAEKETAKWRSQVETMTKKIEETEELVRTHQSALATARAEIAAVAQTVSDSHTKAEEAIEEATRYKDSFEKAIAEANRLKVALRGAEDREAQISADFASLQETVEIERNSVAELKKQLEEVTQGVELQTPSGPLNTGNSAAVQAFLDGQSNRIAVLEKRVEASHREKEEETAQLRGLVEMTRTQSELLGSQLAETKKELAMKKVTLESLEGKLKEKEVEVEKLREEGTKKEELWRETTKKDMETLNMTLAEREKCMREMEEKLEEAKAAIQKRNRFIESSKAANEKLRKNEEVYKEAIAELKRYAKEREKELNELYKEMRSLKVIQSV